MSSDKKLLGDFATVISGYAFKSEWFGTGNDKVIRIGDLQEGSIQTEAALTVDASQYKISDNFKIQNKDILMALSGATVGKIAVASDADVGSYINQRVAIIRAKDEITADYLKFFFSGEFLDDLLKNAGGAAQPNLSPKQLLLMEIPFPPLAEQRRIASILDQADELRQKRQQAIEKLDQLLQATFIDMFGDPVSNPKGWDKKLLSDLVTIDAPLVEPMEKEFENLLHYGPDRISKDSGKLLPALTAKEDMLISKKFLCDDRHILYSKIRPYLNKVAMVQEKCLCSADVYPVEPKSQLTKHFLWHILRSKSFLDHAETFSNRANIPKINRNQFLQYECIVPTMEAQQKFENISKDIQRQIDFQNLSLESIEKLFSSLQNQAFNGTL